MSGLDIEAIRERSHLAERLPSGLRQHAGRNVAALSDSAADVPALLAEVERLNTEARDAQFEVVRLRGELAESGGEVKRLREWNDEIKAERDDLAQRCLAMESEIGQLTPERDDARAALSDALQVIADLRGGTP